MKGFAMSESTTPIRNRTAAFNDKEDKAARPAPAPGASPAQTPSRPPAARSLGLKEAIKALLPREMLNELKRHHYYRVLRSFREEEERDMALLKYLVRPGDRVLDIGANIGIYTRALSALVGPGGEVHSMEAVPDTCGILASNVSRMGLTNVTVINCAVSDADGHALMDIPGFRGFYRARIAAGSGKGREGAGTFKVKVEARRLDSLFPAGGRPIAFAKCDVEGHELSCVQGAAALQERDAPPWLMEIGDDPDAPGSKGGRLLELFREAGYDAWWFDGGALRRRLPGDASVNYFLLKRAHLERMAEAGMPYPLVA
jgi:FkbM family methyltransferase